ncbi:MAG: ArsR/SmtB family transcription factor [Anaerolineae bacterium]
MFNYMIATAETDTLAEIFKALSHPKRLQILDLLMEGVQCNCELAERLGLSLSLISHHMRILERAGLVRSQRDPQDARWIYFSANPQTLLDLRRRFAALTDPSRIQPRQPACGPRGCRSCGEETEPLPTELPDSVDTTLNGVR